MYLHCKNLRCFHELFVCLVGIGMVRYDSRKSSNKTENGARAQISLEVNVTPLKES